MKNCINCGITLADDEYFCGGCGAYQPEEDSPRNDKVNKETESENKVVKSISKPEEKMIEIDMEEDEPVYAFNTNANSVPLNSTYQNSTYVNPGYTSSSKKSSSINPVKIALVAVIIIGLLVVGYIIKDRFIGSPKKTAVAFMDALCDLDFEKMVESMANGDSASNTEVKEMQEYYSAIKTLSAYIKISYKIDKCEKISSVEKDNVWITSQSENSYFLVSKNKVDDVRVYYVTVTNENTANNTTTTSQLKLYVGKYKWKWKVVGISA